MNAELWLAVGTIVTAILTLGGIIYSTRQRAEPLTQVVNAQAGEIERLTKRVDELEKRLGTVSLLERSLARAVAITAILSNQLRAAGQAPMAETPPEIVALVAAFGNG